MYIHGYTINFASLNEDQICRVERVNVCIHCLHWLCLPMSVLGETEQLCSWSLNQNDFTISDEFQILTVYHENGDGNIEKKER